MIYHYIKSFHRSIQKNRFFYTINLIGFLAGFLLLTIIFTFVYQEFSFDKFHKNRSTIYRIHAGGYGVTPLCLGEKLRNQLPEIKGIVRLSSGDLILNFNQREVEIGKTYYTDPEIFQVFSFKLNIGHETNVLKAPFSMVINQSIANQLYRKHSPLGEPIQDKDGIVYTITGVMEDIPYNSHIQSNAFISIETLRQTEGEEAFNCGSWCNLTYLQLTASANPVETAAKLNALLEDSRMETSDGKIPLQLQPLKKIYFDYDNNKFDGSMHGNLQTVVSYFAIAILILFIVIINYINLSTAISGSRIKEISIQKVNGANRIQIIKQLIFESIGVAVVSFIVALFMIELLLPQLSHLLNLSISPSINRSSLYVYYFTGIVCIGLITGLFPGIFLANTSAIKALKNGSVFYTRGMQRKLLLVFQLIIVAVLLNCTFIISRQISYVFQKDMGFQYENVIAFDLDETLKNKSELLKDELLKKPEIKAVSFSNGFIGDGFTKRPTKLDDVDKLCNFYSIDPDYLDLFGIKLKYGRNFSPDLITDIHDKYMLNETACKAFGIENPVGKFIHDKEIIGVVYDFNFSALYNKIEPLIMYTGEDKSVQMKLAAENQEETIHFIKKTCKNISPEFECNASFLDNRIKKLYKSELDLKSSFVIYSTITFLIALLGLFGLTLFQTKKKTKEIGIRKLFGAGLYNTFQLFIKEQLWIVGISNAIAIPISILLVNKWLTKFQYHIEIGSFVFLKTTGITTVFTLLAVSFLIISVHKTNLVVTLKHE